MSAAQALLDRLPADLSVPSLLHWLHGRVGTVRPGYFTLRSLPLFDDIRDPLDTLVRWEAASVAAVETELGQTVGALTTVVQAQGSGRFATALPPAQIGGLPVAALGAAAEDFVAALEALAAAVQAADATALPTALVNAQGARASLLAQNTALASGAAAQARTALLGQLATLPGELDAGLCRLLVLLQPRATLADLTDAIGPLTPPALPPDAFAPLTEAIDGLRSQLDSLLDAIDLSALTQPLADALQSANDAVQAIEQGLAQLSAQVVRAIGQARQAVQAIDLDALRQQAENALQQTTDQIAQAIAGALGPATQALADALDQLSAAMDAIDPEALAAPVRDAIQAIGGVLQQDVVQRLAEVIDQLEQLAQTIATLSFEPAADEVIALIGQLRDLITGIDVASLPDPGPALIREAMQILPPSLVPVTEPLIVDLDGLIAGSPVELLEQVKTLPDQVRAKLLEFSPRRALQPVLSAPFQDAVAKLDDFAPSQWLAAGDAALGDLRQRLAAQLDIAHALTEPARAFASVSAELDRIRPSALLAPVEQAIEDAVRRVATALPAGDLATALNGVLDRIGGFTATVHAALEVASHLTGKLAALGDARGEFETWVDGILVKVPETATGALAIAIDGLRAAALNARPATLDAAWQGARAPLAAALQQADATRRLTRLALARSRILAGLAQPAVTGAVPGLAAWLDEAATRGAGDGLTALAALERVLAAADAALAHQFAELGLRFPDPEGPLAPLVPAASAPLRDAVRTAMTRQLGVPLLALLDSLKPLAALVDAAVTSLRALADAIDAKLASLLAAPQALAALLGSVTAVQQRLASLDLGIYTREVDTVFAALSDELRAIDPGRLRAPLEAARDRLLGQLSLQAILPPALRGQLDGTYDGLVAKLGSLDPDKLLLETLDEEYRQTVEPLVEALDVSATVQIVIDWLNGLPDDLRAQIARIDGPYGELLRSAPGGGGGGGGSASAGVSL